MKIVTQRHALENGLTRYYTGKKCIHNHDSERYAVSGECVACNNERAKKAAKARSDLLKKSKQARQAAA
ncbi:hypothetical protein [Pantoea sp. GM01]|uniref:hypothetical protein n=1 Tax=Pantoea sp. GM01 TaxID=1144320 RepID=UPI0002714411|nr:hypothetical protein [Pantoea sp. GM01]EJL80966.1 hypothetical protein PMI17_05069 [Pantoea sp. GM01]